MAEIGFVPMAAGGGKVLFANITKAAGIKDATFLPPVPVKWIYFSYDGYVNLIVPGQYVVFENEFVGLSISSDGKTVTFSGYSNYTASELNIRFIYGT